MTSAPSGQVTFLFTDVEGSTELWDRSPKAMKDALAEHDLRIQAAIERHHGYVFTTAGDSFAVAFASPQDALAAAIAGQLALLDQDPRKSDHRFGSSDTHLLMAVCLSFEDGDRSFVHGTRFDPPPHPLEGPSQTRHCHGRFRAVPTMGANVCCERFLMQPEALVEVPREHCHPSQSELARSEFWRVRR